MTPKAIPARTNVESQGLQERKDARAEIAGVCVHELFEAQVARDPSAIAIVFKERQLSYREVNERANQVAHYLRKRGVGPETLVGVCIERSPEMVIALLGVWKAGAAYVPLDPAYPQERLSFMVSDANAKLLLTEEKCRHLFPSESAIVICLDSEWAAIGQESASNPLPTAGPSNLAYVMYTSGSTGQPKGAMIPHRALANYLCWAVKAYAAKGNGAVLVHSSIAFDSTVASLYPPLLSGGQIELLPEAEGAQGLLAALRKGKNRSKVVVTPSHLELLNQQLDADEMAGMTEILVVAGESLRAESLSKWKEFAPTTRLFNEYGPTETAVGCCAYEVRADDSREGPVPIGKAVANAQLYVLDDNLDPVQLGAIGELYIGGAGVARGYLNRAELTREKFLDDPFSRRSDARLYKTGDLVCYRQDGTLEFRGRADNQVKIRGYRVELGEIEATLADHPGIQSCAVLAREDDRENKHLVAYVVAREGGSLEVESLQNFVKQRLPEFMVPAKFVFLESFLLTQNGKIDRRSLPAPPADNRFAGREYVAPRTETEKRLAVIWMKLLNVERIGIHDDLFEFGADSLHVIRAISQIQKEFGVVLNVQDLLPSATIGILAETLLVAEESKKKLANSVPAQTGPKKLAFWLAGGAVSIRPLLLQLGTDQPFHNMCLKPEWTDPLKNSFQLEEFAQRMVSEIRETQPVGPYYVGGICLNAAFAFEVARQLMMNGQHIGLLALFEPFEPGQNSRVRIATSLKRAIFRLRFRVGEFRRLRAHELPKYMHSRWKGLKLMLEDFVWRNAARLRVNKLSHHSLSLEQILFLAASAYRPKPLACPTVIFRCKDWPMLSAGDRYFGWREFLTGRTETYEVPGDHTGIFQEPNVQVLAEKLRIWIQDAPHMGQSSNEFDVGDTLGTQSGVAAVRKQRKGGQHPFPHSS